jgi:hypothetical protein
MSQRGSWSRRGRTGWETWVLGQPLIPGLPIHLAMRKIKLSRRDQQYYIEGLVIYAFT